MAIRSERTLVLPRITRGLNTRVHSSNTPSDQTPNCANVDFSAEGIVSKRTGADQYGTTIHATNKVRGAFQYTQRDGDTFLVYANGTSHYYDVAGTPTTFATSLTEDELFGVSYQNTFYHTDGSNGFRKWTGSGSSSVVTDKPGAGLKCKYIEVYEDRIWLANETTTPLPYRLYYSDTGNAEASYGSIDIVSHDGTPITGLVAWKEDFLLVFKTNSLFHIHYNDTLGTPAYEVDQVFPNIGTSSPRTIVKAGQAIIFLGTDKRVHFVGQLPNYPEGAAEQELSYDIRPSLEAITNIEDAAAWYHQGRYFLSVTTSGTSNNQLFVYNVKDASWTIYTGWNAHCGVVYNDEVYFGGSSEGKLWLLHDEYHDDDQAILAFIETKYYDFGIPYLVKTLNGIDTIVQLNTGSDITLSVKSDFASTGDSTVFSIPSSGGGASAYYLVGGGTLGETSAIFGGVPALLNEENVFEYFRFKPLKRGQYFQFRISNVDTNEAMRLLGFVAHVSAEGEGHFNDANIF